MKRRISKPLKRKTSIQVTTKVAKQTRQANRNAADVAKMTVADKCQAAFELYLEHHSERDIAIALGVHQTTVSGYIKRALEDRTHAIEELTPHIRALEIQRCDQHILHWYARAKDDIRASELLLHWTERKHKILGTDISRSEISGPGGGAITINAHSLNLKLLNARQLANLEEIMRIAGPQTAETKALTFDQRMEEE